MFGLIVLQVALAIFAFSLPVIGALHGMNALLLLGTAIRAMALTRGPGPAARAASRCRASVPARSAPGSSRPV